MADDDDTRNVLTAMVCEVVAAHYGLPKEQVTEEFQLRFPLVFLGARLMRISPQMFQNLREGMPVRELVDQIITPTESLTKTVRIVAQQQVSDLLQMQDILSTQFQQARKLEEPPRLIVWDYEMLTNADLPSGSHLPSGQAVWEVVYSEFDERKGAS